MLGVGRTEAAILYWANKAYRADTANSGQRLIRLIWLMLFIKADVPDMAIGIYLASLKRNFNLLSHKVYWVHEANWHNRAN